MISLPGTIPRGASGRPTNAANAVPEEKKKRSRKKSSGEETNREMLEQRNKEKENGRPRLFGKRSGDRAQPREEMKSTATAGKRPQTPSALKPLQRKGTQAWPEEERKPIFPRIFVQPTCFSSENQIKYT
jgi:hypothetical protein